MQATSRPSCITWLGLISSGMAVGLPLLALLIVGGVHLWYSLGFLHPQHFPDWQTILYPESVWSLRDLNLLFWLPFLSVGVFSFVFLRIDIHQRRDALTWLIPSLIGLLQNGVLFFWGCYTPPHRGAGDSLPFLLSASIFFPACYALLYHYSRLRGWEDSCWLACVVLTFVWVLTLFSSGLFLTRKSLVERCDFARTWHPALHSTTANGETLLHFATFQGDTATIQLLLKNGADVNVITRDGKTPLALDLAKMHMPYVPFPIRRRPVWPGTNARLLLEAGANPELGNYEGGSALKMALDSDAREYPDVIELLKKAEVQARHRQSGNKNTGK